MRSSKRGLVTALALALAVTLLAVASTASARSAKSTADITAVFSNIAETPTLDPAIAFSSDGFEFVRNVYEGLLEYVPGKPTVRPLLATKWTVSPDGKKYTFTLRSGVTFSDGEPFNAQAAKTGLDRIKGVNQGPATLMANIVSVAATNASTLVITLKQPDVYFLGKLPKLPFVSPKAIADNKAAGDDWAGKWFATNAAGTGPYKLVSWQRNSAINLDRNDSYWRPFPNGTPHKVVLRVDPDVQTALQLLAQGKIDMMGAVGPDDSAAAEKLAGVKLVKQPAFLVQVLPLNILKKPLDDVRVRKAIALAFDYQGMVDFYKGFAKPGNGPLPADFSPLLRKQPSMKQNLAEAKRLLKEAGHEKGFEITYLGLKGLSYEEFAGTLLQSSLAKIGIKVKQTLVPWPQMVEVMSKPDTSLEISFLNQSPLTNDPTFMLASSYNSANIASKGGYNWSYFEDKKIDAAIAKLSTIKNDAVREQAVAKLNKQIADLHLNLYIAQPILAQPVRKEWNVTYENMDYNYLVRFFYARKSG